MAEQYEQYQEHQVQDEEEEDANTTTVQFIAVSADEHERMVREGELPPTIQVTTSIAFSLTINDTKKRELMYT